MDKCGEGKKANKDAGIYAESGSNVEIIGSTIGNQITLGNWGAVYEWEMIQGVQPPG